ncbi:MULTISPECIES: hypothetical protein [unclassified Anaeromyxobacter]|uniref:hypothetical protein n=1 Tax=unclassified Anaeromyxobacter TaxID=2620896 RepID=UPI001F57B8ED|nr:MULTISPECIES: hypothetical protein [unclassified Anaeromyxobacter]
MTTKLERPEVENLIKLMREQPATTAAQEAPEVLRRWLNEPDLVMDAGTRALIEATVGKK